MLTKRTPYNMPYKPYYKETIEFFIWRETMFPEENKPAEFHFQLIDFLEKPNKHKSVSATRGGSKSTTIGIYWLLRLAWRGTKKGFDKPISFVLYTMDTATKVKSHFERLEYNILDSSYKNYIDITKRVISKDGCILELTFKDTGRTFTIAGLAMGQNIRSLNIKNKRPEVIICDDIENRDNTQDEEQRKKVADWFYKDVEPAGIIGVTEYIFIGTPLHKQALLIKQQESKKWLACKFPLCEDIKNVKGPEEIISCWEDRFPPKIIWEMYQNAKADKQLTSFMQEYMLSLDVEEESIFELVLPKYNPSLRTTIARRTRRYLSIDLAVSEKSTAHYTAIAVIGLNWQMKKFLLDGNYGRWGIDDILENLFNMAIRWNIDGLIMEQVAFQRAYKYIIEQKMAEKGLFFEILTFNKTRENKKIEVFKAFATEVNDGKFVVPDYSEYDFKHQTIVDIRTKEFLDELIENEMPFVTETAIYAEYDDLLDAVAQTTQVELEGGSLDDSEIDEYESDTIEYKNPYIT